MPCVCRKTITPTQPKPASLNSYTLRSFVINPRKGTAPGGQVPTGILVQVLDLTHEHSHSYSRLGKSTFPSSPVREEMHLDVCRHSCHQLCPGSLGSLLPSSSCSSQVLNVLLYVLQLLEGLECPRDTSALGLSAWMCTRNFPWTFIIPGTAVNSWLGNWANLLELFISQVLFF